MKERKYRYIKQILLYAALAVVCFLLKIYGFGFVFVFLTISFSVLSYVRRDKTYVSPEEAVTEYAKYKVKKKKKKKKDEKAALKSEYDRRMAEIEEEFDFDYGDESDEEGEEKYDD